VCKIFGRARGKKGPWELLSKSNLKKSGGEDIGEREESQGDDD